MFTRSNLKASPSFCTEAPWCLYKWACRTREKIQAWTRGRAHNFLCEPNLHISNPAHKTQLTPVPVQPLPVGLFCLSNCCSCRPPIYMTYESILHNVRCQVESTPHSSPKSVPCPDVLQGRTGRNGSRPIRLVAMLYQNPIWQPNIGLGEGAAVFRCSIDQLQSSQMASHKSSC